jgi:PKD domain
MTGWRTHIARIVVAFAIAASSALLAPASGLAAPARLGGTFTMAGKLTYVRNVYGERRGQRVQRTWIFLPHCSAGVCNRVTLVRRRSGQKIRDVVVLKRRHQNQYVGTGHFWIALNCDGKVIQYGGRATEKITVRVTRTQVIGGTLFATGIKAAYQNPTRVNLTACPGGIGQDAAAYSGKLTSTSPPPPVAGFSVATNPAAATASFTDKSGPGISGAPIISWAWSFGDPASPVNTSSSRYPTHQFSAHGTYTVTLQARDANGQTATTTQQVTV